jgi:AcrR family transcriptional regulator
LSRQALPEAFLATARTEFLRHGFDGTDVNRIARRSGSSPTAFYRLFKDKTDIFIAIYRDWSDAERRALSRLLARNAPAREIAQACVDRHRIHAPFRRSVSQLAREDPRMRRAVAEARLATLASFKDWTADPCGDHGALAFDLIRFEQIAIALAEGDLTDMGFDDAVAREHLAAVIDRWRGSPRPAPPIPVRERAAQLA